MLLPHAFGEPVGDPRAFDGVMIDRPNPATVAGRQPPGACRRHVNRMLDAEDEMSAGDERAKDHADEPPNALDVMQGKRAVGEIVGLLWQFQAFQISAEISHARIGRFRSPRESMFSDRSTPSTLAAP